MYLNVEKFLEFEFFMGNFGNFFIGDKQREDAKVVR